MSAPLARAAVHRIACAMVAAEVRRLRGADLPSPHDWRDATPIGDDGLGLDSLEQIGVIAALAEAFGLDDTRLEGDPPRTVGAWVDWIMRRHVTGDARILVTTSGSTGRPVACVHAVADLLREARYLATLFPDRRRVVALVPAHHLYGVIWTAILPSVLDIPVVVRSIGAPLDLVAGDLVVAVPDQWAALGRIVCDFAGDVVGVSSAAPLDDALAADLLAAGLHRLFDVYGSSETGAIAIRELPALSYDLLPYWHLSRDEAGAWQLGDAAGGCRRLPDHVEPIGARGLRPTGRRDGAVQVGGHNVWPARVADTLRGIDGVADAAVRLHTGGRLKAFIVPARDHDPAALTDRIEHAMAARLSPAERPRSLRFGAALPRNQMGKLEDWS